jgi:hypothetical protein
MAAKATFALNSGAWFRRVRFVMLSPDSRQSWPLSGRKSTYRSVQNPQASSLIDVSTFRDVILQYYEHPTTIGAALGIRNDRFKYPQVAVLTKDNQPLVIFRVK